MTATEDAATIRQAVRVLLTPRPPLAVLAAVKAPLITLNGMIAYLEAAARHTERWPPCCRAGADRCTYAGPALARSRSVNAAATQAAGQTAAENSSNSSTTAAASLGETNSSRSPSGAWTGLSEPGHDFSSGVRPESGS